VVVSAGSSPGPVEKCHPLPSIPDHELIRRIGAGSYGEVWLAQNALGAYRAVKIVYRSSFGNDRPFEREFNGIKKFEPISRSHDSQVDILHVGRNGYYFYYVMELADAAGPKTDRVASGIDLETDRQSNGSRQPSAQSSISTPFENQISSYTPRTLKLEACRRGRLPVTECIDIGIGLTTALAHLHNHGLVHRDVKPSNVIFVKGVPKLADIGLVTDFDATVSCVGTEGFLPPEGPGSPPGDLYALGKVLYEISTGKDRHDYPEPPTLLGDFEDRLQLLELGEIIKKACEPEPAKRYQTAEAMQADLLLLKTGKSVRQAHRLERRLKLMTRFVVGAAAVLILGVIPYFLAIKEARRARLAEADAEQKLWGSYLAQAQALRYSHRAGRRFEGLDLLAQAARIRTSLELRNEAIACMALPDMHPVKEWNGLAIPSSTVDFDFQHQRYVRSDGQGNLSVRSLQNDQEQFRLPGQGVAAVMDLSFSPGGHYLMAGYDENLTTVWEIDRRKPALVLTNFCLRGHSFSADETTVAAAQRIRPPGRESPESGLIHLYNLGRNAETWSIPVPELPMTLRFSPSGQELAACFYMRGLVRLIDPSSGRVLRELRAPVTVNEVAWHPDGARLAAAGGDGRVYVWDLSTTNNPSSFAAHSAPMMNIQFSGDGHWLATSGWDDTFHLWEPVTGREILSQNLTVSFFRKSADDRWWGYKLGGNGLGIWEAATERELRLIWNEEAPSVNAVRADYSPAGPILAVAYQDGVRIWNVLSGKELGVLPLGWTYDLAFTSEGAQLLTCSDAGLQRWPLLFDRGTNHVEFGAACQLSPAAGRALEVAEIKGGPLAYVQNGKVQFINPSVRREKPCLAADFPFTQLSASPDGKLLVAWGRPADEFQVWDVFAGRVVKTFAGAGGGFAAFSPNARWLALGDRRGYQVVEVDTWKTLLSMRKQTDFQVLDMAFSPDNNILALSHAPSTVQLFDTSGWHELARLEAPHPQAIVKLNFSPDGTQLVAAADALDIQVWNLALVRRRLASLGLDWACR
jgi:WD40 repeat protein